MPGWMSKSNDNFDSYSVGDYEILRVVGHGSFGIVYEALHHPTGEKRALKCLESRDEDTAKKALESLSRDLLIRALDHPNIVTAYEPFEFKDPVTRLHNCCLPMEFLEGYDLKEFLKKTAQLSIEEGIRIFLACADALAHASEKGVVHRDLKPSNIFLCTDDRVKVVDFGVGRKVDGDATQSAAGIPGTLDYVAPDFIRKNDEEFRGDEVSDIFSFGVCFYEALTGKRPFESFGSSEKQRWIKYTLWAVGQSPSEVDYSLDCFSNVPSLVTFVEKCLARERQNRFSSFLEVRTELRGLQEQLSDTGSTGSSSRLSTDNLTIGRYRITKSLPGGGFARIRLAEHLESKEKVVLKILRENLSSEENIKRFRREFEILDGFKDCSQIVNVHEWVEHQNDRGEYIYAIAMDYVEGHSLHTWMQKKAKPEPMWVLSVMRDVLKALVYAHERGVVHRDLKPHNILCSEQSNAVVIDFGIAFIEEGSRFTNAEDFPGSWDYMAPECGLLSGDDGLPFTGDAASDLYSYAVCFYEALTGRLPFDKLEGTLQQILIAFLQRVPTLSLDNVDWDHAPFTEIPKLRKLISKYLEPNREKRGADAASFLHELETLIAHTRYPEFERYNVLSESAEEILVQNNEGEELAFRRITDESAVRALLKLENLKRTYEKELVVPRTESSADGSRWVCISDSTSGSNDLFDSFKVIPTPGSEAEKVQVFNILQCVRILQILGEDALTASDLNDFSIEPEGRLVFLAPCDEERLRELEDGRLEPSVKKVVELLLKALELNNAKALLHKLAKTSLAQAPTPELFTPPMISGRSLCSHMPELTRILARLYHGVWTYVQAEEALRVLIKESFPDPNKLKTIRPLTNPFRRTFGADRLLGSAKDIEEENSPSATYDLRRVPLAKRYEIIDVINVGGCGIVCRAVRLSDATQVAVKYPKHGLARFTREIEIISQLSELLDERADRFVKYIDHFSEKDPATAEPNQFLVMEYLQGTSLSSKQWSRSLDNFSTEELERLLNVFGDFAAGFQLCHEQDFIHRDIKPGNLFITQDWQAKILDFGIARDIRGTKTAGQVPGTLVYMAPEFVYKDHANAETRQNPRIDVFGLGVTLYKLLTGEMPYHQDTRSDNRHAAYVERALTMRREAESGNRFWFPVEKINKYHELPEFFADVLAPLPAERIPNMSIFAERLKLVANRLKEKSIPSTEVPVTEPEPPEQSPENSDDKTAGTAHPDQDIQIEPPTGTEGTQPQIPEEAPEQPVKKKPLKVSYKHPSTSKSPAKRSNVEPPHKVKKAKKHRIKKALKTIRDLAAMLVIACTILAVAFGGFIGFNHFKEQYSERTISRVEERLNAAQTPDELLDVWNDVVQKDWLVAQNSAHPKHFAEITFTKLDDWKVDNPQQASNSLKLLETLPSYTYSRAKLTKGASDLFEESIEAFEGKEFASREDVLREATALDKAFDDFQGQTNIDLEARDETLKEKVENKLKVMATNVDSIVAKIDRSLRKYPMEIVDIQNLRTSLEELENLSRGAWPTNLLEEYTELLPSSPPSSTVAQEKWKGVVQKVNGKFKKMAENGENPPDMVEVAVLGAETLNMTSAETLHQTLRWMDEKLAENSSWSAYDQIDQDLTNKLNNIVDKRVTEMITAIEKKNNNAVTYNPEESKPAETLFELAGRNVDLEWCRSVYVELENKESSFVKLDEAIENFDMDAVNDNYEEIKKLLEPTQPLTATGGFTSTIKENERLKSEHTKIKKKIRNCLDEYNSAKTTLKSIEKNLASKNVEELMNAAEVKTLKTTPKELTEQLKKQETSLITELNNGVKVSWEKINGPHENRKSLLDQLQILDPYLDDGNSKTLKAAQDVIIVDIPKYNPLWSLKVRDKTIPEDGQARSLNLNKKYFESGDLVFSWSLDGWNCATHKIEFVPGGYEKLTPPQLVQVSAKLKFSMGEEGTTIKVYPVVDSKRDINIEFEPDSQGIRPVPAFISKRDINIEFEPACKIPPGKYDFVVYKSSGERWFSKQYGITAEEGPVSIQLMPPFTDEIKSEIQTAFNSFDQALITELCSLHGNDLKISLMGARYKKTEKVPRNPTVPKSGMEQLKNYPHEWLTNVLGNESVQWINAWREYDQTKDRKELIKALSTLTAEYPDDQKMAFALWAVQTVAATNEGKISKPEDEFDILGDYPPAKLLWTLHGFEKAYPRGLWGKGYFKDTLKAIKQLEKSVFNYLIDPNVVTIKQICQTIVYKNEG